MAVCELKRNQAFSINTSNHIISNKISISETHFYATWRLHSTINTIFSTSTSMEWVFLFFFILFFFAGAIVGKDIKDVNWGISYIKKKEIKLYRYLTHWCKWDKNFILLLLESGCHHSGVRDFYWFMYYSLYWKWIDNWTLFILRIM